MTDTAQKYRIALAGPGIAMKYGMTVGLLFLLLPFSLGAVCLPGHGAAGPAPEGAILDLALPQGSLPHHQDSLPYHHDRSLGAQCGPACTIGVAAIVVSPTLALFPQRLLPAFSGMAEAAISVPTLPPRA